MPDCPSPRLAPVLLPLVLAAALAGCGKAGGSKPAADPGPLPVATMRAKAQAVPISLEAVGQAEGSREVEVRARVTGIIERRLYEEGAAVAAGTLLFEVDPAQHELAVQQARAALAQERVKKDLAEGEALRLAPLAQDKAIPQREVDQAVASAKHATAAIAAAESRLREAELNLSYTRIRAPIPGVTGRALRSEGSLVTANAESSLLTTITQVDPVWVRFSLAERDFATIRGAEKGARVQLLDHDGGVAADGGKLNFAGSTVDPKLGTVQMRASFPNGTRKWLPGQFLKVRILAGEQSAFLVPQAALLQGEQSRLVMVVGPDGRAAQKPVKTGSWIGSDAIVTGGLAEGDVVIVDNLAKVKPGTPVKAR